MTLFYTEHFQLEVVNQFLIGIHFPSANPNCIIAIHIGPIIVTFWSGWTKE